MTVWGIEYKPAAARNLAKLPKDVRARIVAGLERLASTGHGDVIKMDGTAHDWRLRVGSFRVIFRRDGDRLVILVLTVGNRRDVYRD